MKIVPIRAFSDNYIWTIHATNNKRVAVVDPGDAAPVLDYLEAHQLELDAILITHYHNDHIGGVNRLKEKTACHVYGSKYDNLDFCDTLLTDGERINLFNQEYQFAVLHVPGHTLGHIAYYDSANELLFCGDTLFRAGCGRMFEGEPEQFYASLQRLAKLPANTRVYCTHEYTLSNLAFAEYIEPNNPDIKELKVQCQQLRDQDKVTLPSTIASELLTNPFLRCEKASVVERMRQLDNVNSEQAHSIFASMRRLKDNF